MVGWDPSRLAMVIAVLETHAGVRLGQHDVYLNVAGGLRITEPAADLAAAAQISVTDYLGGIDWKGHDQTARWYRGFKSRPSFRPLLSERMELISPPAHYDNVDF